jgi:hypothetical protein
MNGLFLLSLIVAGLALLGAAAVRCGVDSRIGLNDTYGPTQTIGLG